MSPQKRSPNAPRTFAAHLRMLFVELFVSLRVPISYCCCNSLIFHVCTGTTYSQSSSWQYVRQSAAVSYQGTRYVRSARAHVELIDILISFAVIVSAACQGRININSRQRAHGSTQRYARVMIILYVRRKAEGQEANKGRGNRARTNK